MDSDRGMNRLLTAIVFAALVWLSVLIWAVISLVNHFTN